MMRSNPRAGFTLLEIVIGVVIFAIGALGVFGLAGAVRRMNALSNQITVATVTAESRMDRFLAGPFSAITNGTETTNGMTLGWSVATNAGAGTRSVTVVASWQSVDGAPHTVTLRSLFCP